MSVEMYFEVNARCCSQGERWGHSRRQALLEFMTRY